MMLRRYGFIRVGAWTIKRGLRSGISFQIDPLKDERVIYAFVVNKKTKYIGICENRKTCLLSRMNRYKSMQGSGTNEHIAKLIRKALQEKKTVEIYALNPQPSKHYKGLSVDLVKGLENPLIAKAKPEWNRANRQ